MRYYPVLLKYSLLILLIVPFLTAQDQYYLNLAKSLEKAYRYEDALDIYQQLYKQHPNSMTAINGIVECLKTLQRYEELISFIEQNIRNNRGGNTMYLEIELGAAHFLSNDRDGAMAIWDAVIAKYNRDIACFRILGAKLVQLQAYQEAIDLYKEAMAVLPKQEVLHLEIGNLYQALLAYDMATRHYLAYYHANPKIKGHIERQIMRMSTKTDNIESITGEIKIYLKQNPGNSEIREVLAGIYLEQKQYDKAFEHFKMLENETSKGSYYLRFAREACKNDAWLIGIAAYQSLLERFPRSPLFDQAQFELADGYAAIAAHDTQDRDARYMQHAVEIFTALSKKRSSVIGRSSLVKLGDIYRNYYYDLDEAIAHYQAFIKIMPAGEQSDRVKLLLGDTYLMKGDLAVAERYYLSIAFKSQANAAAFKLGELDFYRGNFSKSLQRYDDIISIGGTEDDLTNNALDRRLFISTFREDSLALSAYARAELNLYQNKWQEAAQLFYQLGQRNTRIRQKAGLEAGRIYMQHKQYEDARLILSAAVEMDSSGFCNDEAAFLRALNEELAGNIQQAFELYQTFLVSYPNSVYVHTARQHARQLSERIKNEQI